MPHFEISTYASQLFWLAVTFGLTYVIMAYVCLPKVGRVLHNRQIRIQGDLEKAHSFQRESEKLAEAYAKKLASSQETARSLVTAAQEKSRTRLEGEAARLQKSLLEKTNKALAEIDSRRDGAMKEVQDNSAVVIADIVAKTSGVEVAADKIRFK